MSLIAASLNGALAALRQSRATAEVRTAYDEFLQRLDAGEIAARACRAGDRMPELLLPSADGRLVASGDLLAQGSLVVHSSAAAGTPLLLGHPGRA